MRTLIIVGSVLLLTCSTPDENVWSSARMVEAREDLIGGPRALGEVGDIRLENDQIRVIIQGPTHARTLGIYGGGLIDVDLQRPGGDGLGNSSGGIGFDALGEIFPTFLLQAIDIQRVEIRSSGADGTAAQVAAVGTAGDFVQLAGYLNRVVLGSHVDFRDPTSPQNIQYEITYTLEPGTRALEIGLTVTNISTAPMAFPSSEAQMLAEIANIDATQLPVPVGDIAAFSSGSRAFVPGIGFDLRFGIEDAARVPRQLPALPGIPAPWIATRGRHVSYGLVAAPSERNYAWLNRDQYGSDGLEIDQSTIFVPFAAGGFVSVFYDVAPPSLAPGESFTVRRFLVVGSGDVGSVLEGVLELEQKGTGTMAGQVVDALTREPAEDVMVLVYKRAADGSRRIFSQYDILGRQLGRFLSPSLRGTFGGALEPGSYSARVTGPGRPPSRFVDFEIAAGQTSPLRIEAPSAARLLVHVRDQSGAPLPARVSVVGAYGEDRVGNLPREFLYDLRAGEHPRVQDLVPDDPLNPSTRRYIEAVGYTDGGVAQLWVRPGSYEVVSSRGIEYDTASEVVELQPGSTTTVSQRLRRVVDTTGWISADTHLHAALSHDSSMELEERVRSIAAEGVEWAVSTDHNYVTDYGPVIARLDLLDWMRSSVGLEVTTVEAGHYNAFPLEYQVAQVTKGAIDWADRPPREIFDRLRSLGSLGPANTLVQINHARAPVLGYFQQFRRDTFTMEPQPRGLTDIFLSQSGPAFIGPGGESTFSLDFDLLELATGKLYRNIHHYRVPEGLPPDAPDDLPPVGAVVVDEDGQSVFPGSVDDWYTLLNQGHRFVGVGTSDSHGDEFEAGFFRSMVHVGVDDVWELDDQALVDAFRRRRVVVTNGPMIDFYVDDPSLGAMGQTYDTASPTVQLGLSLQAPPWVRVARINIVRNGAIAEVLRLDETAQYTEAPFQTVMSVPLATNASAEPIDSWFVVEVIGSQSMFPVVKPYEVSPFQITEAVNTLTGGVSLFGPSLGSAMPSENLVTTPYAITNPVWVNHGGGAWTPPGVLPREEAAAPHNDSGFPRGPTPPQTTFKSAAHGRARPSLELERRPGERFDIQALIDAPRRLP